jgi:hypothetical protein
MKQFNGFAEAQEAAKYSGSERLPVGAYECQVKNVQYVTGENGNSDRIDILFDIIAGDQKDFFKKQYDNNAAEDKKWKGRKSIYVPTDDGSERDGWTKNTFAKWTNAFEDSNEGYKWDWKEEKWKGLKVGIVFGETGTVIEGREILFTEPRFAVSIDKVRDGSAPAAKFVAKNGYTGTKTSDSSQPAAGSEEWMKVSEGKDEEIPF